MRKKSLFATIGLAMGAIAFASLSLFGKPMKANAEGESQQETSLASSGAPTSEAPSSSVASETGEDFYRQAQELYDKLEKIYYGVGGVALATVVGWALVIAKTVTESKFKKKMDEFSKQAGALVSSDNLEASAISSEVLTAIAPYLNENAKLLSKATKAFAAAMQYYSQGTPEGNRAALEVLLTLGKEVDVDELQKQLNEVKESIASAKAEKEADKKKLAEIASSAKPADDGGRV